MKVLRSKDRALEKPERQNEDTSESSTEEDDNVHCSTTRNKRIKLDPIEKPCIICNYIKKKGQAKRYRVCEVKQAKQLLLAMTFFKGDVFTRCTVIQNKGDAFAADIMYHSNCLSSYILRFKRKLRQLLNDQDDLGQTDIDGKAEIFESVIKDINLKHHTVYISTICDSMSSKFQEQIGGIQF